MQPGGEREQAVFDTGAGRGAAEDRGSRRRLAVLRADDNQQWYPQASDSGAAVQSGEFGGRGDGDDPVQARILGRDDERAGASHRGSEAVDRRRAVVLGEVDGGTPVDRDAAQIALGGVAVIAEVPGQDGEAVDLKLVVQAAPVIARFAQLMPQQDPNVAAGPERGDEAEVVIGAQRDRLDWSGAIGRGLVGLVLAGDAGLFLGRGAA